MICWVIYAKQPFTCNKLHNDTFLHVPIETYLLVIWAIENAPYICFQCHYKTSSLKFRNITILQNIAGVCYVMHKIKNYLTLLWWIRVILVCNGKVFWQNSFVWRFMKKSCGHYFRLLVSFWLKWLTQDRKAFFN